jgi:hypothetical protein
MNREELINLANALLNQNGYDENGSKITDSSKNQNAFENKMIKVSLR